MNSNVTTVLNGALAFVLLLCVIFCIQYTFTVHQIRSLTAQAGNIDRINKLFVPALANDCIQYSKKNPAINPILESIGIKTAAAAKTPIR